MSVSVSVRVCVCVCVCVCEKSGDQNEWLALGQELIASEGGGEAERRLRKQDRWGPEQHLEGI